MKTMMVRKSVKSIISSGRISLQMSFAGFGPAAVLPCGKQWHIK